MTDAALDDTAMADRYQAKADSFTQAAIMLTLLGDELLTNTCHLPNYDPSFTAGSQAAFHLRQAANALTEAVDTWNSWIADLRAHADGTYTPLRVAR